MTTPTSAHVYAPLQRALRQIACLVLCAGALGAAAPAVAQAGPEITLLDDRAAWVLAPQPRGPVWEGEALLVPALVDGNAHLQQAMRPVSLGAAASWRARLRLAAVQPATADAALGLVLVNAQGGVLAVMVRPVERDVVVIRSSQNNWRRPLAGFTAAPMLAGAVTAANVLEVESQGSRLRVSLNGQSVLTAPLLDFSPVKMGLRASNTQARVDQWVVQQIGQDTRLARLAGLTQAPGVQVSFEDRLVDTAAATRVAQSLFSGVSSLFSSTPEAAKGRAPIDASKAWPKSNSGADTAFTRDTVRKQLVVQTKSKEQTYEVVPNSHDPMFHAAVAVQATLAFPLLGEEGSGGLVLLQSPDSTAANPPPDESLFVQVWPTEVRLYERTLQAGRARWQLIDNVPHGVAPQRPLTLRLVHQGTNAWVFVDGRLLIAADNVKSLRINNAGLRTEGVATMEVSHFLFTEI